MKDQGQVVNVLLCEGQILRLRLRMTDCVSTKDLS